MALGTRWLGWIFGMLFGRLEWHAPPWLAAIVRARRERPRRFWGALIGVLLVGAAASGIYYYVQHLPQPLRYAARVNPPGVTPIVDDQPRPQSLRVRFEGVINTPDLVARYPDGAPGIARLDLVGKELTEGVYTTPVLNGKWRWEDENTLLFEPAADWPAARTYNLRFAPVLFTPETHLVAEAVDFSTPGFEVSLADFTFYQDPVDKSQRKTVATFRFSHPVDAASFERNLVLAMRPSGATIDVQPQPQGRKISYDTHHREAYVHSDPVVIGAQEQNMVLTLAKGVATTQGGALSAREIESRVLIPSVSSYFKVGTARSEIVRNADNDPEQTLILQFTDFVNAERVVGATHAWLLPLKKNRHQHWKGPREVTEEVLAGAEPVALRALPTEEDSANLHSFVIDLPEGRDLYLRLDGGLRSDGGFVMANAYDAVLRVPAYPKEAQVMASGSLVARTRDLKLPLLTRGLETLRFEVARLLPGQLNHLLSQTSGDISQPQFTNYRFNEDDLTERFEGFLDLSAAHPRAANYASLDLARYLGERPDQLGLFLVRIEGWDKERRHAIGGTGDRRLVLITDLGMVVKDNVDTSHEVFVQSVTSGLPVAGAEVALLGRNGVPVLSGWTDTDGHVHFAETRDFNRERQPAAYVVRTARDVSFIPFDRAPRFLNYSRFDIGGLRSQRQRDDQLTAFLFSDRGIYRPGEEGHLGAIVRRLDFAAPGPIPLEALIRDPQGQTLLRTRLTLAPDGFLELGFETDAAARTGTYQASISLVEENNRRRQLGSTEFRVEEFQPDTLKVRARLSVPPTRGWIPAADIEGLVELENLFGAPAVDRRVDGELTLSPSGFHFKEFSGYRFIDPYLDPQKPRREVREQLDVQRTDAAGHARFVLPLSRYEQGTYRLLFATQGYEAGEGRSVLGTAGALVSPATSLVGYKADADLNYLKRGAEHRVELVAVDPGLAQIARTDLTLRLIERSYVSTLVQQRDGTLKYQSVAKRRQLSAREFAIPAAGTRITLDTAEAGDFELELVDAEQRVVSRIAYTVVGARNLAGELEKNAELTLKLDRSDYRPGEEIELAITAPYHGAGLITIERDRVYAFQWFKSETNSSVQRIRLPEGLEGNAYVNVAFIRAADSREIFISPLSYAVAPVTIDRAKRQLKLRLEAPELVKPGDELTISYAASAPARVALFAVDEGILQVAGYQTPQPLDHFLQKRALEVRTAQIVDLILPEFALVQALAAGGGDMAAAMLARNLNPFARRVAKPVAFWAGLLDAGETARVHRFTVPDTFNGRLRIMAVAVGTEGMGSASREALVHGPFVLSPGVPTAVAPADEFEVTVGVANTLEGSGEEAEIELEAQPSANLEVIGEASRSLRVSEGSEGRVVFKVRARDALGAASLRFRARHGEEESRITATLSVRPAVPHATSLQAGYAADGEATVAVPRELYAALGINRVTASVQPRALSEGLVAYLDHFPHQCTEQILSRVYPLLAYLDHPDYQGDVRSKHRRLTRLITSLRGRQSSDGGFSLWPGTGRSDPFPSLYAAHFLTDAKSQTVAVPPQMLARALDYLRDYAGNDPQSLAAARQQARALYVLTRNGQITTNLLVRLHEVLEGRYADRWRGDVTAAYLAATYALLAKRPEAEKLIDGYRLGRKQVDDATDYDSVLAHDAQFVYLVAKHFPDQFAALEGEQILAMLQPLFEGRFNTVSSAASILALGAYSQRAAELAGPERVAIAEIDAAGGRKELEIQPEPFPLADASVQARQVAIDGAERLFYLLAQSGFDRALPTEAVSNKLEIVREFLDDQGNPVLKAAQGQELTVRVRVRATAERISNVAVVDLLPGGFEVQRDSVRRTAAGWQADYTDVREDRVVFYGGFGTAFTELSYRVKLTARGSFVVPPPYAEAMYDRTAMARGLPARFEVVAAP